MKAKAEFKFVLSKASDLNAVLSALEQNKEFKNRCVSKVRISKKQLLLTVEASDIVALRATVNSYLRVLQVIEGVSDD